MRLSARKSGLMERKAPDTQYKRGEKRVLRQGVLRNFFVATINLDAATFLVVTFLRTILVGSLLFVSKV